VEIEVDVVPDNVKSDVRKNRFVEYSENMVTYSPVRNDDCTQVLKYGIRLLLWKARFLVRRKSVMTGRSCTSMGGYAAVKYGYPIVP
jgi:hypothetical protein